MQNSMGQEMRQLDEQRRWRVWMGVAALTWLLTACSSNSSRPAAVTTRATAGAPAPVATRAGLLAVAQREWQFFGGQQIDMRQETLSAPRLGLLEDEGEAVQRIGWYWQAVGRNFTGADTQQPWSAAFISYLMKTAGVSADDFLFDEAHFNYLSFLKQRQAEANPMFVLRPVASEAVTPGDLVCASRDTNSVNTIEDIRPGLPGHCDLVLEVHPELGWAGVIGGNVFNSVSESLIPVSDDGRVIPFPRRPWFVVVKNLMH
jgi:hypothetical protein